MDIQIDTERGRGRRDEIYLQIRAAILDGRLREGETLPPTRELAQRLAVARNTVAAAYDRLGAEGFLAGKVGAGTFVRAGASGGPSDPDQGARVSLRPNEVWERVPDPPRMAGPAPRYDFRAGLPDARMFPFDTLRRLLGDEVRAARADTLNYGEPAGQPELRAAVARHLGVSRGLPVEPADLLITGGTQQALDLIAKVLLRPGQGVAVEDPGYPPARLLFETFGVTVIPVPVDEQGIVVAEIPEGTRLVYVTPSHQFPLGMPMSLERRQELIRWARRSDAVLIEDDYDTEFRYVGRPLEPLYRLDEDGRVLYTGSFSKSLSPALRLGFLVPPRSIRAALVKAKYLADWHSSGPIQSALARFIDEGGFARHLRRMRREYRARHELVAEVLRRDFAGVCAPIPSPAGLHLSAWSEYGTRELVRRARRAGVGLYTLGDFSVQPGRAGLVFGYGSIPASEIEPGLTLLRPLFDQGK
ncbi:PLP-dependent aminotransferase family protein [Amycolatopsis cihanbeyliensis]|uniref:GntR family transcriptional regulator n=1 Tax=Amycolatopsis cihanbeyliensis TaxID=1128664 RepID=A0A542DFV2_AMYCI|nr:PLP-dependent aminotransferase family protein [Amycolatopsis cihanbeyliensis]TQJ01963.1 GntR family transcriptional regulator [Amycolatopsis cihanbeyliensis]